jgi:hypothetical protein
VGRYLLSQNESILCGSQLVMTEHDADLGSLTGPVEGFYCDGFLYCPTHTHVQKRLVVTFTLASYVHVGV